MATRRIDAILIDSPNAKLLVEFYRGIVGLPLEAEQHGGSDVHWGCFIEGIHFAIHQEVHVDISSTSRFSISFEVHNVDETVSDLRRRGVEITLDPHDRSFGRLASIRDPDGNTVYLHSWNSREL